MKIYKIVKDGIFVSDKSQFNPKHILECGQAFCYNKMGEDFCVFPQDKFAQICEKSDGYLIKTDQPDFFVDFFDLNNDYAAIKAQLGKFEIMQQALQFGYGIRILKQNLFEMLISFIVSQNNNIKRIAMILNRLRENLGDKTPHGYAFPTQKQMLAADQQFFASIGCGYRAAYLFKVVRQVDEATLQQWGALSTPQLRQKLISLVGVGPKVADCILLFGYGRGDVFPVDTWIHQMYNSVYPPLENREKIRQNLVEQFGKLSGYAQQYLFYYQRSGDSK